MANLRTYWGRLQEPVVYYVGGVYRYSFEKDIFLWAQAIAFKALITVVPIIILVTGVLGRILSNWLEERDAFESVAQFLQEYLPAFGGSDQLLLFVDKLQDAGTFFTGLGIFALIFAAMTLFTTLRVVIGNVFQEEWHRHRSILGGYVFDLRMAVQVGLLFLLTIGLTFLATAIKDGGIQMAERFSLDYVWLRSGWRLSFKWLSYLIPYLLSTAMFFQLFFFVPQPHPPKRSALIGAVVTGVLWEAAKLSFTLYATSVGRFDRYIVPGTEASEVIGKLGEAFGLIVALVFWIYYSGVVLIVGALIAVLNEKRVRMKRLKKERERMEKAVAEGAGADGAHTSQAAAVDSQDAAEANGAAEDARDSGSARRRRAHAEPSEDGDAGLDAGGDRSSSRKDVSVN